MGALRMTLYGIDVSNHQRNFDFAAAKREGFTFATHKVNEGTGYRDPYWPRAKEQMAEHFPGRHGGYVFCKVDADPQREADTYFAHGGTPTVQIDYEDLARNGSTADLWARINAFLDRGARLLPIYIPRWYWSGRMGSPDLSKLPVPIWNSHYVNGSDYASRLYPGDQHAGWAPVGGRDVAILQFSESARVAGQSIDVNAFRGDDAQLAAMFSASITDQEFDMAGEATAVAGQFFGPDGKGFGILGNAVETDPTRQRFLTEAVAVILTQLAGGPNFEGWEQLGDGEVKARTVVDGMARIMEQNNEIIALLKAAQK
jgi:GH25 family lysozyme M1 (1,4-beta-N-acetylmuramidase)